MVRGLRRARLGAIGARPAAFNTVRFSEKILERAGISVVTADLSSILGDAQRLPADDPRVAAKAAAITGYADASKLPQEKLLLTARLAVVIERWCEENAVDATAVQCWNSIQANYGVNACTVMSMLSESLRPSACETDVTGALSMYALQLASGLPSALVDWNNNYGDAEDRCVLFHCGNWPVRYAPGATIGTAPILGTTLGEERTWGTINGRTPAGPCTFARIGTDDTEGRIRAYVGEGRFTDDPLGTFGCRAVVEVPGLQALLRHICREGFEHHAAVNGASVASAVGGGARAVSRVGPLPPPRPGTPEMSGASAATARLASELRLKSVRYRKRVLQTIVAAGAGHTGGDLSCVDILAVLYGGVLKVSPETAADPDRDRFVMSKGHSVEALYVVLADRGFFPLADLATVCRYGSHYVGHPTRHVPGIEQNTGALGHGLAFGVGTALAARLAGRSYRTFVLAGDGELAEGSNWEASLAAAHHRLDNLVLDRRPQRAADHRAAPSRSAPSSRSPTSCARSATRCARWTATTTRRSWTSFAAVPFEPGRPSAVLARTVKGRGVSFIENDVRWHHRVPKPEELARAMAELEAEERRLGAEPEERVVPPPPARAGGAVEHGLPMGRPNQDVFSETLLELARADPDGRGRDQRLARLRQAVRLRRGAAGPGRRGRHRRADAGRGGGRPRLRGTEAVRRRRRPRS